VSKQKPEQPEEQQQSNTEPPVVPTWEGGNLRAIRTPQRPGSAASALGLARSASVPNVQRPSSAPTMPSDREIEAEVKKDPAKWYIPANTYRTQYMEDYSDAPVENANGAPRPRSVVEVRQEVDRRQAKQSMTRRPSTPSMADLTAYFYTSESAAQFRKYTEKETSDCRGTMCDWQTSKAEKERTDQVKENLSQLRQSREARKAHRPPKVPLKQDISTPTSSKSSKSKRRPKSLADLLNMQDGHAPVPNRNAKPDDDAVSEATTASAPTKESLSEVCSLDSARTDSSARTTASSVYSSRSSVSCRSSRSSVSTRSSSSSRSSASLRSSSSKRSSSKDSISLASVSASSRSTISLASSRDIKKSESERKLEKVSTASVCGSSMGESRPPTAASDCSASSEYSASSAVTFSNRSVKTDSSNGTKRSGTSVDRLQLDNKAGHERPNVPNLEMDKKPGGAANLDLDKPRATIPNITTFSRHIG